VIRLLFLFLPLALLSCSASLKTAQPAPNLRYVSFHAPEFKLHSSTSLFSEHTRTKQISEQYVTRLGDQLLQQVLVGYSDQTEAFRYADTGSEHVRFDITKVVVSRGYFTTNIPHPGPIYKVKMYVDLIENGLPAQSVVLKQRVNMSEINFPEERFKWMTPEEKDDSTYQEKTFRVAVRKLYQQLYFTYFDISLQL
jgi:hypothetical protein